MKWFGVVALIVAAHAGAVHVNPGGSGQVLIYPYYTIDDTFQTLLTVVNHTDDTKIARVSVRESINGRLVERQIIYLAPRDTWTAAIFRNSSDGTALIQSADESCNIPDYPLTARFRTILYTGAFADGGPQDEARNHRGYVEVFELGILDEDISPVVTGLEAAVLSPSRENCRKLLDAWTPSAQGADPAPDAYWVADPDTDVAPPRGGLSGTATLVRVDRGTAFSYSAIAIENFFLPDDAATLNGPGGPNGDLLTLAMARQGAQGDPVSSTVIADDGVVQSSWDEPIDAISAVLMAAKLDGEFSREPDIESTTEWIFTLPTRFAYVNGDLAPRAPFQRVFGDGEPIRVRPFDRSAEEYTRCFVFADVPPAACAGDGRELAIYASARVYSSQIDQDEPSILLAAPDHEMMFAGVADGVVFGQSGSISVDLAESGRELVSREGHVYHGLPIIALQVLGLQNGTLQDGNVLANFGARSDMVRTVRVEGAGR